MSSPIPKERDTWTSALLRQPAVLRHSLKTQCPSPCLLRCYLVKCDILTGVPNVLSGLRKRLQKMKGAFVGLLWQSPVQAGPLSQDPLREEALMSVGRLPTEAARVLATHVTFGPKGR